MERTLVILAGSPLPRAPKPDAWSVPAAGPARVPEERAVYASGAGIPVP